MLLSLLLAAATMAAYWQVVDFDLIHFDDYEYTVLNPHVNSGLSLPNVRWALTAQYQANWVPLTWISFMMDWEMSGGEPGQFHLTNVILHVAASIILLLAVHNLTGMMWRSAFVAALFALHPMHVESVAWVAERKDVLCGFFWMLTMFSYARYAKRPAPLGYLLVICFFSLALLSKAMAVTLPLMLLLLDFWPLGRRDKSARWLVLEKLPLLCLSAAASIMTILTNSEGGTLSSLSTMPLWVRLGNAPVAYVLYIWKMIWPQKLAFFYPHPGENLQIWLIVICTLGMVAITWLAAARRSSYPFVAVGWFWYLLTLLPVIGIVHIGVPVQIADRFTYIPLIGLFILIAWGVPGVFQTAVGKRYNLSPVLAAAAFLTLIPLTIRTVGQVKYWQDDYALFSRALEVTKGNYLAHYNLGNSMLQRGDLQQAEYHFRKALEIKPDYSVAHQNLGALLLQKGDLDGAIRHLTSAVRSNPRRTDARFNLAMALMENGDIDGAIVQLKEALRINPNDVEIRARLQDAVEIKAGTGR